MSGITHAGIFDEAAKIAAETSKHQQIKSINCMNSSDKTECLVK